jgi:hypothetical protein
MHSHLGRQAQDREAPGTGNRDLGSRRTPVWPCAPLCGDTVTYCHTAGPIAAVNSRRATLNPTRPDCELGAPRSDRCEMPTSSDPFVTFWARSVRPHQDVRVSSSRPGTSALAQQSAAQVLHAGARGLQIFWIEIRQHRRGRQGSTPPAGPLLEMAFRPANTH